MLTALVAGVNAAANAHTAGVTLKPWGASEKIEVPGYRYQSTSPPFGEATEMMQVTVSGWLRGATLAETVAAAITQEVHGDKWRTWRGTYWRAQVTGVRVGADEEPGVYRFDMDIEMEAARDVAYRY